MAEETKAKKAPKAEAGEVAQYRSVLDTVQLTRVTHQDESR